MKTLIDKIAAIVLALVICLLAQSLSTISVEAQTQQGSGIISSGQQPKFCPFFAGSSTSQPYVGGYMATDDINIGNPTFSGPGGYPYAIALSADVSFMDTIQSNIQSDNFLAAGIVGQGPESQPGAPSIDYGYSLMLVLDGPSNIYIEGAVWACYEWGRNGNMFPLPECDSISSWRWWSPYLTVNSVVWLAVQWTTNPPCLNYLARVGGVTCAMYSYAPVAYESPHFMLGTEHRSLTKDGVSIPLPGTIKFFQFVGAASNYYIGLGWRSWIDNPSFMWENESDWRVVQYGYATQGQDAWLDQTCLWGLGEYNYVYAYYYYDGNYDLPYGSVSFYPTFQNYFDYIYTDTLFWDPSSQQPPPTSGCPYVSTWNGSQYVLNNNLLTASEFAPGSDVKDYYVLQQTLAQREDGTYSLMLSEFENERDLIDRVKLLAIDHPSNVNLGVSPSGEILTYRNPHTPVSAITNEQQNVKQLLSEVDGSYYQARRGSYVVLNFGDLNVNQGAKLVLRADNRPIKDPIYIQVGDSHGSWSTVATVIPRVYWSTDIIEMSKFLPDAEGNLKVRLCFTADLKVDFVGLDTNPQTRVDIHSGQLISAFSSSEGDVATKLLYADRVYAELVPGENIQLAFKLPCKTMQKRTYVIIVEGHYFTITP